MKKILTGFLFLLAAAGAFAGEMGLQVTLSNPVVLSQGRQTNYIRVGLTGFQMAARSERPQINAALVMDVSGSMSGEKMRQSVQAAHTAIDMLKPGDSLAIIAYSDYARVVIASTVITPLNRNLFHNAVNRLESDGSTALFDGVSLGAQELARFRSDRKVNRVILLSDGQANVGPSSPYELGNLGEVFRRQGISVTTIGLGNDYNADLMYELAARSDGNHAFVESPRLLASIFEKEFSSMMTVVAQNVEIIINCEPGVKPVRVLNRDGEIRGSQIVLNLNQVYSEQEQYVIVEVEMEPGKAGESRKAAAVSVNYLNMESKKQSQLGDSVVVGYTAAPQEVAEKKDKATLSDVTLQIATEQSQRAVQLRDEGRIEEAEGLLLQNAEMLGEAAKEYDAPALQSYAEQNLDDAAGASSGDWDTRKKQMREDQKRNSTQQVY